MFQGMRKIFREAVINDNKSQMEHNLGNPIPQRNGHQEDVRASWAYAQIVSNMPIGQSIFSPHGIYCGPIGNFNLDPRLNLDPRVGLSAYSGIPSTYLKGGVLVGAIAQFPSMLPAESILWSGKSAEEIEKEVVGALENANYDWRTIDGIVRETHLPKEEVCDMIKQLAKEGILVRAPYLDKQGRQIYTTRKHYHETVGLLGRLISSLTNRIV
jgi:hypothetical protein